MQILNGNNEGLHFYSKNKPIFRGQDENYDREFNERIAQIASLLVTEGIKICIKQYQARQERDSRLGQPIIDLLNQVLEYAMQ